MISVTEERSLRVVERHCAADAIVTLVLVDESGTELPEWTPGAHVDVAVPGNLRRQYSLCGDPRDRLRYRLSVLREPDGRGSAWIHDALRVGDRVEVSGPRNHFALEAAREYVFIAGGIGITPILPMIEAAERAGASWVLHYGGRSRTTMAHLNELEGRAGQVHVVPEDEAGQIDLATVLAAPSSETLVYCCGPDGLIAAVEAAMADWPEGGLHVERFAASSDADLSQDSEFDVRCESSDLTVRVGCGQSILTALAAVGIELPTSCGEGTCGTCESEVLEGVPDHRDSVLSAQERADNHLIMPCVSRSFSDLLVLDL